MNSSVKASQSPGPAGANQAGAKRAAILAAATAIFLKGGYLGTNMDEIAALSAVSKQTVYKHFASKEALFVEIVTALSSAASASVHDDVVPFDVHDDLAAYLLAYAERQLATVLTPQLMQLRRLVIGEVTRFPQLAQVLFEQGPHRAMTALAKLFVHLAKSGSLQIDDPMLAASHFNWLVMGEAVNRAMLLGDQAIAPPRQQRRDAKEGVRVFLAAYGPKSADQIGQNLQQAKK